MPREGVDHHFFLLKSQLQENWSWLSNSVEFAAPAANCRFVFRKHQAGTRSCKTLELGSAPSAGKTHGFGTYISPPFQQFSCMLSKLT